MAYHVFFDRLTSMTIVASRCIRYIQIIQFRDKILVYDGFMLHSITGHDLQKNQKLIVTLINECRVQHQLRNMIITVSFR